MTSETTTGSLRAAARLAEAATALSEAATARAAALTNGGSAIDDHQVLCERLALMATAQDRQAAALMGVDTERMFALGWGIGAGCVGTAGGLLAMFFYVFPEVGASFALIAYVTVALGGFGNVPATLLAGVVVGLVEVFGGLFVAPSLKYVFVFLLYLVVVLWRPQGLLGRF